MSTPRTTRGPGWGEMTVLLVGVLAVVAAAGAGLVAGWQQWAHERERADGLRADAASQASLAVTRDIDASRGALEALGASLGAGPVSASRFLPAARIVQRRDSIVTVAWVPEVTPGERAAFERALGRPVMRVAPGSGPEPAPRDAVVHPVALQVSGPGWPDMRGRDLVGTPPARHLGMAIRRDPGRAFLSAPTRLANGQRGVALAVAVTGPRGRFRGAVVATVVAPGLMAAAEPSLPAGMVLQIADGDDILLGVPGTTGLEAGPAVGIGGRTWTFSVSGGPAPSPIAALLLVGAGLLSAAALAGLFGIWLRRERYAQRQVAQRLRERVRLEDDLRAERDRLARVLGALMDGLLLVGPDGRIIDVNDAFCAITGHPRHELRGRGGDGDAMPFLAEGTLAGLLARRPGRGAADQAEFAQELVHRDGTVVHTIISAAPLTGARGEPAGHVLAVKDVTEAEHSRRALGMLAREQAAIGRLATGALGDDDLGTHLSAAAGEAARMVGAAAGAVLRLDPGDRARWVAGWPAGAGMGRLLRRGASLDWDGAGIGAHADGIMRVGDAVIEDGPAARACRSAGMRSCVAVPVRAGERPWGVLLVMERRPGAFSADDARRVANLGEVLSLVVAGVRARQELISRALQDPLTGLANHRAFFRRLDEQIARARRYGDRLSLVMLDLDHFKRINDTHGHQVGDEALASVAGTISACARAGELVGRIGGDEFAWILPGADLEAARAAVERARRAVRTREAGAAGRLSLSVGIAELDQAGDMAGLVRIADGALYHAKAEGRDRVVCYSPDTVTDFSTEERTAHALRDQAMNGLRALARAVDAKDPDTREHSERVGRLAALLARARGWDAEAARRLREAALVHDVGKVGVPDSVLFAPRSLTPREHDLVKMHVPLGADITKEVLSPDQVAWVRGHHERWDGTGYPDRLAGTDIPEGARILALADAWDVMCGVRAYRRRLGVEEALAECRRVAGGQFDPALVALLGRLWAVGALEGLSDGDGTEAGPVDPAGSGDGRGSAAGSPAVPLRGRAGAVLLEEPPPPGL